MLLYMFSTEDRQWGKVLATLCVVVTVGLGISLAVWTTAAPPISVTYRGARVTTAVPGKPFTVSFQVKNTGTETYSGATVIFHIPDGLTHSKVVPADAQIQDDTITWTNIPFEGGQSFYPSFTFTVDKGTPIDTKLRLWFEVTGNGFETTSTNFSVTAKAATATSTLSSSDITSLFQSVYGRTPTSSELTYWLGRRSDKPARSSLLGAMMYHKALSIPH